MTVLFICTANIVRSFMAERILKKMLIKNNRHDVVVQSAGMIDMHGAPGDVIAAEILTEHGFDGNFHSSRRFTEEMLTAADWIILMENAQMQQLRNDYPQFAGKFYLLKTFSKDYDGSNADIRDPYRQSIFNYRLCFAEIYTAVAGMMQCI